MECKICLVPFDETTHYPMSLPCGHTICVECAQKISQKQSMCPKCQQPFKEYKRNYELNEVLSHSKPKKDYAALFKVAVVGTTTVGKSSIIRAFRGVDFTEYLTTTIGNDFAKFDENYKGLLYRIQLWDTAGQQRFNAINRIHYQNAQMIIVVFDVNNPDTLQYIKDNSLTEIEKYSDKDTIIMILGNKTDLQCEINMTEVRKFAEKNGYLCAFVSAKTRKNIHQTWEVIVRTLASRFGQEKVKERSELLRSKKPVTLVADRPINSGPKSWWNRAKAFFFDC